MNIRRLSKDGRNSFRNGQLFKFAKKYPKSSYKHQNDKRIVDYLFNNGDTVVVACYDYSEAHGGQDHLSVAIDTNEIYNFFINEAYK